MLKNMIQKLMAEPGAMARLQNGQLQLAGVSEIERRALVDVIGSQGTKNEPMKAMFWS
ncbi:competence pheromone ComX [Paenibacillus donghaensis]|uniref:competence pheromone ComX n=1 Tax=Paenibacillus donghaensis TaxID=414771 RepID=UPI0012FE7624|nr:competence pheromone ComX [Paenibacillus donghaensis]